MLLNGLEEDTDREAMRVGEDALTYAQLRSAAGAVASRVAGAARVAVWATSSLETCVAVVGAVAAGVPVVPINPKAGTRELEHILSDSCARSGVRRRGGGVAVDLSAAGDWPTAAVDDEAPAIVVYTSGTTGPPKGVVLPRRAIASNLDALGRRLGVDRRGRPRARAAAVPRARADPRRARPAAARRRRAGTSGGSRPRAGAALAGRATMLFGVPTMYHRLAADLEASPRWPRPWAARGCWCPGSAALPAADHERIAAACGRSRSSATG